MPPSPRWLLLRAAKQATAEQAALEGAQAAPGGAYERGGGQGSVYADDDAARALRRLRSSSVCRVECDEKDIAEELASIRGMLREENASTGNGDGGGDDAMCAELYQARRALVAGLGLVFLQQVTGQPSILYYQEAIFRDAGFGDLAPYASVIVRDPPRHPPSSRERPTTPPTLVS